MSNFDKISSHLVECKCRSGSGVDGSLHKAERIQEKVAEMKGGSAFADTAAGKAVYLRVSSGEESRLAELIPSKSERIQLLHHAYTYGRDTVAYLVGNPQGSILFVLIVTFEADSCWRATARHFSFFLMRASISSTATTSMTYQW